MTAHDDDLEMLQVEVKRLRAENKALRFSLWDQFFKVGLVAFGPRGVTSGPAAAAEFADSALAVRNKRWGVSS